MVEEVKVVSIRLPGALVEVLRSKAEAEGVPMTWVMRRLLMTELEAPEEVQA